MSSSDPLSDIEPRAQSPATPPPPSTPSIPSSPGSPSRLDLSPFTHNQHRCRASTPPPPQPQQQGRRGSASSGGGSSEDDDLLTRDNRDVLVQRLADLAERLTGGHFRDEGISELHRRVDELEDTVRLSESPARAPAKRDNTDDDDDDDDDTTGEAGDGGARPRTRSLNIDPTGLWAHTPRPSAPLLSGLSEPGGHLARGSPFAARPRPSTFPRSLFPDTATGETHLLLPALVRMDDGDGGGGVGGRPAAGSRHVTAEDAARIAREAEQLNFHLATLTTRLRARQEESEHVHSLLIERAERAAQRIIVLEVQVGDLTSSLKDANSELSNLRIALKAIELQCPAPQNLDEDLRRSIQNWKADWKRIRQARAARSSREVSFSSTPGTPGTPW